MFDLQVLKSSIHFRKKEFLVSNSLNIYLVKFKFSPDWDELAKVVYFTDGFEMINVLLDEDDSCFIPHEVLQTPKREIKVGVRGTLNGEVILPTVWLSLGKVEKGVEEEKSEETQEPTPELIDQVLTKTDKVTKQTIKLGEDIKAMSANITQLIETVNLLVDKVNELAKEEEPMPPIEPVEPDSVVNGIEITTPPDKTEYTVGEVFDPTGMIIMASYTDDSTQKITDYTYVPTETLTIDDNKVVISYMAGENVFTAEVNIVVKPIEGSGETEESEVE